MSIDNFAKINESDSTKSSTIFFFYIYHTVYQLRFWCLQIMFLE